MSIRLGNQILAKANTYHPNLFDFKWTDHKIDDIQWLNADNFSWNYASVYTLAYEHLLDDWNNAEIVDENIPGLASFKVRLAPDGHKLVSTTNNGEERIQEVYDTTGIAWYYIIDLENRRFKLPRSKHNVTGLRNKVGNYVDPGLPNITGSWRFNDRNEGSTNVTGAYRTDYGTLESYYVGVTGGATNNNFGMSFDASRSNAIYGNANTVQPAATEAYLYFYVGNFVQDVIENVPGGIQDKDTALNYDTVTNCITEIPQDIKLELNSDGQAVLKAGSTVYIPNGFEEDGITKKFTKIITTEDIVKTDTTGLNSTLMLYYTLNSTPYLLAGISASGTTTEITNNTYYRTDLNEIRYQNDTTRNLSSLPLGIITYVNGVAKAINQVFNGFGYVGTVGYVLPGIKYLFPNGRKPDGKYNNILITTPRISMYDFSTYLYSQVALFNLNRDGLIDHHGLSGFTIDDYSKVRAGRSDLVYDSYQNKYFQYNSEGSYRQAYDMVVGTVYVSSDSTKINRFCVNGCFADIGKYTTPQIVTRRFPDPANNYSWYRLYSDGWVEQGGHINAVSSAQTKTINLLIAMKDANYTLTGGELSAEDGFGYHSHVVVGYDKTATSFKTKLPDSGQGKDWQVSGMADLDQVWV